MPTLRITALLLSASLALVAPLPAVSPVQQAGDAALEPLADSLRAYLEARAQGERLEPLRHAVVKELAGLEGGKKGVHPLGSPERLGRALWLARQVARPKAKPGKVIEAPYTGGSFQGSRLDYAFRLPKGYEPEQAWPLILSLPDAGESPAAHLRSNWVERDVLEGAILVCPALPGEAADWSQVMVTGRPGGLARALTTLRLITEQFSVDDDRVFVAGRGESVPAAVALGDHAPQRFAGVIGRAGDAGELAPDNFLNLPTYFASGGAQARAFLAASEALGHGHCKVEANAGESEIWSWMGDQRRAAFPDVVRIVVGTPFPSRVNWLRLASIDPKANAKATIDRKAGALRIEAPGVSFVTLYLNDALVNLDEPLTVYCNGMRHQVKVTRNIATTLDLIADGTSDPGAVYVAEVSLDARPGSLPLALEVEGKVDSDYQRYLADAKQDPEALFQLYTWCAENGREQHAPAALRRLLRADPDHAAGRAAAGHVRIGDSWFRTPVEAALFEASQDPERAEARGLVEEDGVWMHAEDRRRINRGWHKDWGTGVWTSPEDRKRIEGGEIRQDLDWVPGTDVDRVDDGLYLVEGEWLTLERANRRRARIDTAWVLPSPHVRLLTTTDRHTGEWAIREMAGAVEDLVRVFGLQPQLPLDVGLLRIEEQYDRFAFGDPDGRRSPNHARRFHVIHHAFYAESRFPLEEGERTFGGMGVGFWDAAFPYGDRYGVHSARLAFGLSWAEAVDPSPKAVRKAIKTGPTPEYAQETFPGEKQLPAWLRWGGAVYAERYFRDPSVDASKPEADPWWPRTWSLENLAGRDGLPDLDAVFAFELSPDDRDGGHRLLLSAGALVAFLIDGGCEPAEKAHADFKRALVSGRMHPKRVQELEDALRENEEALRAFTNLP